MLLYTKPQKVTVNRHYFGQSDYKNVIATIQNILHILVLSILKPIILQSLPLVLRDSENTTVSSIFKVTNSEIATVIRMKNLAA